MGVEHGTLTEDFTAMVVVKAKEHRLSPRAKKSALAVVFVGVK